MWAARAILETRRSARTWFGTLTIAPQVHFRHLNAARARARSRALVWEELSTAEQFAALQAQSGREVTLMLKRLRKATGAPFVYLCVAEAHESGLPHYHLLVHERAHEMPIRKSQLDAEWRIGFCKWRLVNELREATYLCKYLGKATMARVRASVAYGEEYDLDHSASARDQSGAPDTDSVRCASALGQPSLTDCATRTLFELAAAREKGLIESEEGK